MLLIYKEIYKDGDKKQYHIFVLILYELSHFQMRVARYFLKYIFKISYFINEWLLIEIKYFVVSGIASVNAK
jgi:hypothetical protein